MGKQSVELLLPSLIDNMQAFLKDKLKKNIYVWIKTMKCFIHILYRLNMSCILLLSFMSHLSNIFDK